MIFKRKIYNKLLDWKTNWASERALIIQGARRIGKSTIVEEFAKNEYKSYILINFQSDLNRVESLFKNDLNDLDTFFRNLSLIYGKKLYQNESLIIFDEVQSFPIARQAIKHLVKDGRYDYIETGSLASIKENVKDILENGTDTKGQKVRPHWADGTQAYTIKKFGIVNRYDLRKEFPALTLRRTALRSAYDEILWIWQKKSNNIHDLHSHIWDAWADEDGSIGKAYGYQLGVKHRYKEGWMDQVDRVLYDLKNNPSAGEL